MVEPLGLRMLSCKQGCCLFLRSRTRLPSLLFASRPGGNSSVWPLVRFWAYCTENRLLVFVKGVCYASCLGTAISLIGYQYHHVFGTNGRGQLTRHCLRPVRGFCSRRGDRNPQRRTGCGASSYNGCQRALSRTSAASRRIRAAREGGRLSSRRAEGR